MEGIVRFSYKRFIDVNSEFSWDKAVFENSYLEFRIQAQNYPDFNAETDFKSFMKNATDADKIHHRVSPSIYQNLEQLQ